jgi:hypothetical protein
LNATTIEHMTDVVLRALASGGEPTPAALTLLVRSYGATGRDDISETLGPSLASAIDVSELASARNRAAWLMLFGEACAVSDDERLQTAIARLAAEIRRDWGSVAEVEVAASGIDACLNAAALPAAGTMPDLISSAIDELERVVAGAYRPGHGLSHLVGGPPRGLLADHVALSSALLTAFEATARLPYSMLAEELVQHVRHTAWDAGLGRFRSEEGESRSFAVNCEAARVLCRLAALHRREGYRHAAVVAPGAEYRDEATRLLTRLEAEAHRLGLEGAPYGLAVGEWQRS